MKKLGCAKCGKMMKSGGTKKMAKGGMPDKIMGPPKKPFAAGIPYYIGAGQTGPESMKKGGAKKYADGGFPDLTGDGKVTQADVLKGRGVFKKGGTVAKAKFGASVKVQRSPKAGKVRAAGDQGYAAVGKREPARVIKKTITKKK